MNFGMSDYLQTVDNHRLQGQRKRNKTMHNLVMVCTLGITNSGVYILEMSHLVILPVE